MADVEALVSQLTLEEKAALTAGEDFFSTVAVERLDIPKVRLTDGPSGARGAGLPGTSGNATVCIPCGAAVGASWDPDLARDLGRLLGRQARAVGCRVLLAPTVNLHRALLAGRNFECYSEDPLLSGALAAAFVRGVQEVGVIATVKHFVGNESEFERGSMSSVIDERSLRELYLLPFELAVRDGGALAVMTSYNRVNGQWVNDQPHLVDRLLRGEWGFEGLVMTDWFALADTVAASAAGVDLEMPGPGRAFGPALRAAVERGAVAEAQLDDQVRRLLGTFDRLGILEERAPAPVERVDDEEDRALTRRAAAGSFVLLHNDGVLPLAVGGGATVAVLGPNAAFPQIMGGGSSQVDAHRAASPLEALRAALPGATVVYERGSAEAPAPLDVGRYGLVAERGFDVRVLDARGAEARRFRTWDLRLLTIGRDDLGLPDGDCRVVATGTVVADETGSHELLLAQCGGARLLLDGRTVLDGIDDPMPPGGSEFFGLASQDCGVEVDLVAGEPRQLELEFLVRSSDGIAGARVGFRPPPAPDAVERAVAAATAADAAVVFVGSPREWETETRNRPDFSLPGGQADLVAAVAAVNRRTVVVVNAGAPVDLPWIEDVGATLLCWFGGQELGPALADVLRGVAEPSGRLATTIPQRIEHEPAHDNFPGENGELRYGEGLFMGYRGYDHGALPVRFPFGHGLGYTTFEIGAPEVSSPTFRSGEQLTVVVPVRNTGGRSGTEVVQCYVRPVAPRLARPPQELKAFAKVTLEPGATTQVTLELADRSFAYWDPGQADWSAIEGLLPRLSGVEGHAPHERRAAGWQLDPGRYELAIGRSSRDIRHTCTITIED